MADVFKFQAWDPDTVAWVDITNILAFLGAAYGTGIAPGTYQDSTHRSNATFTVDQCVDPNHMNNNKYINNTTVDVNGTQYSLIASPLGFNENAVTLRIWYQNDAGGGTATSCANGRIWLYKTDPLTAATAFKMMMFEYLTDTDTANYQRETGPLSSSWDDSLTGIEPAARGILSDQLSLEVNHYWYLGLSLKKLDTERATNALRFSVDIST